MSKQKATFGIIILAYVAWALAFIWRGSEIGIDGVRYHALFDDALISMRYAWNLSHGIGLVWNEGQYVEGYTNLLTTLFMSLWTAFLDKRDAVLWVKLSGIPILLAAAWLTVRISRYLRLGPNESWRSTLEAFVFGGTLLYYPLSFLSLMGMETGMVTLFFLLSLLQTFRLERSVRTRDSVLLGVFLGLLYLTRADTLVLAVLLLGYLTLIRWGAGERVPRTVLPALIVLVGVVSAQLAFRITYYGTLVPNTYVLKVVGYPLQVRLKNGFLFLSPFFQEFSLVGILALLSLGLHYSKEKLLLSLIPIVLVAYQAWVGGDAWRLWRLLVPGVPALLLLASTEVIALSRAVVDFSKSPAFTMYAFRRPVWRVSPRVEKLTRRVWEEPLLGLGLVGATLILYSILVDSIGLSGEGFGEEQRIALLLGLVMILTSAGYTFWSTIRGSVQAWEVLVALLLYAACLTTINRGFYKEMTFVSPPLFAHSDHDLINKAIALLELTTPEASVGVTIAGAIPYYTGLHAVDFLGKSDPHIASLLPDLSGGVPYGRMQFWPGHAKYDLEYSIGELRPTFVQRLSWGSQSLTHLLGTEYVKVNYQGVELLLLRDSPHVDWKKAEIVPHEER